MKSTTHIKRSYETAEKRKYMMQWKKHHDVTVFLENRNLLTYGIYVEHDIFISKHHTLRITRRTRSVIYQHHVFKISERDVSSGNILIIRKDDIIFCHQTCVLKIHVGEHFLFIIGDENYVGTTVVDDVFYLFLRRLSV